MTKFAVDELRYDERGLVPVVVQDAATRCVWPEVSPLCQSFERERDQNHVSPSESVRRKLSAFM